MTLEERFWKKVPKGDEDDCWEWQADRTKDGYGRLYLSGGGTSGLPNKFGRAHRIAWQLANGEIPHGLSVLHRCDNRACCNAKHLFLGTQADNVRDMYAKGRNRNIGPRGEAAPSAKLTTAEVLVIRSGPSSHAAAEANGISYRHLRQIQTGIRWKHLMETP